MQTGTLRNCGSSIFSGSREKRDPYTRSELFACLEALLLERLENDATPHLDLESVSAELVAGTPARCKATLAARGECVFRDLLTDLQADRRFVVDTKLGTVRRARAVVSDSEEFVTDDDDSVSPLVTALPDPPSCSGLLSRPAGLPLSECSSVTPSPGRAKGVAFSGTAGSWCGSRRGVDYSRWDRIGEEDSD
jgi:hypothetical protein